MFLRSIRDMNMLISKGMSNIYLDGSYCKFAPVLFWWVFLRSIKQINRLISKGISNIYLSSSYWKNWCSQISDLPCLRHSSSGQFLASSNSRIYHWILKLLVETLRSEAWRKKHVRVLSFYVYLVIYNFVSLLYMREKQSLNLFKRLYRH